MTFSLNYSSLRHPEDEQQIKKLISQCFAEFLTESETYFNRIGSQNFRILHHNDQVIAGLAIYFMGQWYGENLIPMAGIAAVGVAPEHRGKGVAFQLLSHTLEELYHSGYPISVLYPATQVLYRKVGYEQGGSYCLWELPTDTIQISEKNLPITSISPINYEQFEAIYQQQARKNNGNLDRNFAIWQKTLEVQGKQESYAYLIGEKNQPEGYVIFTQEKGSNGLHLILKDWGLLTPNSVKHFWAFIAAHRSLVSQVEWKSSPIDSTLLSLSEQTAKIKYQKRWMLRVVNVPLALSKRGYPQGIETELHLEITDDIIVANNGKFCLRVSQGCGEVTPGGKCNFRLNIRGLASLYTGLFTPIQLQLLGYLDATPDAIEAATIIFSGSTPWMPDFF